MEIWDPTIPDGPPPPVPETPSRIPFATPPIPEEEEDYKSRKTDSYFTFSIHFTLRCSCV